MSDLYTIRQLTAFRSYYVWLMKNGCFSQNFNMFISTVTNRTKCLVEGLDGYHVNIDDEFVIVKLHVYGLNIK